MKKNKKNLIITGTLAALCICVLAGVCFLTRTPEKEFVPAATEETEASDSQWTEKTETGSPEPSLNIGSGAGAETEVREGTEKDNTQTVIHEEKGEVVTDLSGSKPQANTSSEKPSAPPVITEDATDPDNPPAYDEEIPAAPEAAPSESNSGNTDGSHSGQVYDPVFGWIDAGTTQGQVIDNDGDINKQVGTMD